MDPVRELKIRADILHARLAKREPDAVARLRALPELRKADALAVEAMAREAQRKHCLAVVAREAGFTGWEHARRAFEGDADETDLGTLLWIGGMLNHWFATHAEARASLEELSAGGERHYLLGYKRHFVVVGTHFIESLGMDPDDRDWSTLAWDWTTGPRSDATRAARSRLYFQRLDAIRRAQS